MSTVSDIPDRQTAATAPSPITILLRLEGLAAAVVATIVYGAVGGGWIRFGLLFLVPDVAMFGYVAGPRRGAVIYNAFHTYICPAALGALGLFSGQEQLTSLALIWAAHIGFDRALGFGLKNSSGFQVTHLSR